MRIQSEKVERLPNGSVMVTIVVLIENPPANWPEGEYARLARHLIADQVDHAIEAMAAG
jgi:hypothetical protein